VPWTTEEKLQAWGLGVTLASTLVATFAAVIAAKALRAQLGQRKQDQLSSNFRLIVLQPAIESLPLFQAKAIDLITDGAAKIAKCTDVNHAKAEIASLITEYSRLWRPVQMRLLSSAAAWPDGQLTDDLAPALFAVGDLTTSFHLLMTSAPINPPLDDRIQDAVSAVLQRLVHYDLSVDVVAEG
jgi:hypothetical protein